VQSRVGIIGAGFIGRFHARAVHGLIRMGLGDAEYVGVCDRDEERARRFAEIAGLSLCTTDPDELISSPEVNTVYVCTPTGSHRDLVLKAARAGRAVFCEKPLARDLEEARQMLDAVVAAGVPHQVGLVLRHSPIFTVMKDLMADPGLGRPMAVVLRDDQFFPILGQYESTWRKDYEVAGGGALLEHSIHDLDLLTWLMGEVAAVMARTHNFAGHPGVEDLASVWLRFRSGAEGHLVSVWHNVLSRPSLRHIEIFWENGYFACDQDMFGELRYQTYATPDGVLAPEEVNERYLKLVGLSGAEYMEALTSYSLEDYFFVRDLAEGRSPFPGFEVAVRAHELVDAVYRSAAEGREVSLPPSEQGPSGEAATAAGKSGEAP
jgi:UDP-N-acetyl-2-amino-2-deoxyglucuronate dehydrogenase